ncbi:MAG: AAA family ATPase [Planctomycetota bacterium]
MGGRDLFVQRIALGPEAAGMPAGYPFDLPAVRNLGEREFTCPVTVFVGENGTGKSTLLEAMAVGLGMNAEGGSANLRFATRDTHSPLHSVLRLTRGRRRFLADPDSMLRELLGRRRRCPAAPAAMARAALVRGARASGQLAAVANGRSTTRSRPAARPSISRCARSPEA